MDGDSIVERAVEELKKTLSKTGTKEVAANLNKFLAHIKKGL